MIEIIGRNIFTNYILKMNTIDTEAKLYYTHWNGAIIFKVEIDNMLNVTVYKPMTNGSYDNYYSSKSQSEGIVFQTMADRVFIGKSPLTQMTEFSGGYGDKYDGNTVLVQPSIADNKYIYIGNKLKSFTTESQIIKYVSEIGNSNVPYAHAVDMNNNFYLLSDGVIITNIPIESQHNVYKYYYDNVLITADFGYVPPRQPSVKNFCNIAEHNINDDHYTLSYHPDADTHYDNCTRSIGTPLTITKTDGSVIILTKEMYIDLMRDFGKLFGFSQLVFTDIITL